MVPEWVMGLTTSDWMLGVFLALVLVFLVDYGAFSPWWKHPIGYITIAFNASILLLMVLIVYGVVYGQRIDEWARTLVALLLVVSVAGKIVILHVSRYQGKIERRERREREHKHARHTLHPEGQKERS